MISRRNILIAPLNWGLGHATRCIPIINVLLKNGFNPIIASDGDALLLLQKEFPKLKLIELPSYKVQYPKSGKFFKWKLMIQLPHFFATMLAEKNQVEQLVNSENIFGIISDNRFGVRSSKVPCVFISHQLNVLSGNTTFITSKMHRMIINKFDECWIPDINSKDNFTKKLSWSIKIKNQKYIGLLSRFRKQKTQSKYDLLILLSGVEPLRLQLEQKLILELKKFEGSVLFVRGVVSNNQNILEKKNITFCNYLLTDELEMAINESEIVLARSGYSTILDLAVLQKKAFFIPTTGQYEQEYLAKRLQELNIAPFSYEKDFKIELLGLVKLHQGFSKSVTEINPELFDLFQSK